MNLQNLLLIILGTSGVLLVVLLVLLNIVQRKLKEHNIKSKGD